MGDFLDLTPEDWDHSYQGLWMSAIEAIHEALPHMKKQNWGRIILSTSTTSKQAIPNLTLSNAYLSDLMGVMKSVAMEVASEGITANVIMPGSTHTRRMENFKKSLEELAKEIPAKRLGKPEEFAALATLLASGQAAYITGQAIACDGGLIRSIF